MGGGQSAPDKAGKSGGGKLRPDGSNRSKSPSVASAYYNKPQATHDDGFLTSSEQEKVVDTWGSFSQDIVGNGVKVFLRIAELEPKIKDAFPFRHLEGEALLKSPLFRGHSSRFMKAVEVTMENLGALEVIVIPNLIMLGRQHTKIRGFKVEYLQIFQSAMVDIWSRELGGQFRGETREGWMKIFCLITSNVLKGYEEGLREMEQGTDHESSRGGSHSSGISSKSVELNANHKQQASKEEANPGEVQNENHTAYSNSHENNATNNSISNSQV